MNQSKVNRMYEWMEVKWIYCMNECRINKMLESLGCWGEVNGSGECIGDDLTT